ncbi:MULTISPECIES: hypothetical protein [Paraburkholderia]|uniref:hypothetical protein n=1 Tax=Paraburkholderia TaxID=1822464 RepID=UPI001EF946AD|nr:MULTISPECIES: hypothetical protein [Paraburkholderia]MDH6148938.1 hypothetical protein [Paraburkholderia sp. WSM4179]
MKKLRLVLCAFSLFAGMCSQEAFPEAISLESKKGAIDYDRLEAAVKQRPESFIWNGAQSFRARFDSGNVYFLAASTMLSPIAKPVTHGYPGGRGWCEFDFFDKNFRYVNGIRVNIQDHSDTNVCNWIEGVSAVTYKNQPALLATVQYHRGIDPAKSIDEIGNNYHRFTALLVLTPHPDGSLSIRQDDSCLGPGNQIGELATARKRITECSQ